MANVDGVKYLETEDELLPQIVKGLRQFDPVRNGLSSGLLKLTCIKIFASSNMPDIDPIFSKKRVEETLTFGYLEFLGVLSRHKDGIKYVLSSVVVFLCSYGLQTSGEA